MTELNLKAAIQTAQLKHLLTGSYAALIGSTVVAFIFAYMQSAVIAHVTVYWWLFLVLSATLIRVVLVVIEQRNFLHPRLSIKERLLLFRISILISCLAWGSAAFFMFPAADSQHQMFLIFMLGGMSAAVVISYSADFITALIAVLSFLLPIIIRLLLVSETLSHAMAFVTIIYGGFVIVSLRNANLSLLENFALRVKADLREKRYSLLLDHSPVGIFHYDANLTITYCNNRLLETLNSTMEKVVGLNLLQTRDSALLPTLQQALQGQVGRYQGYYKSPFSHAEGWLDMVCAPIHMDDDAGVSGVAIIHDITEHKRIEQALIESEYRSKLAIEGSGDGVWDVNVQTDEASYSKRWKEMLGYAENEILPLRSEWTSRIHPDDLPRVLDLSEAYLDGKTEMYVVEYRLRCKNDHYRWMLSRGMLVSRTDDGLPLRMIGTQADITERKLADEKLHSAQNALMESRDRYLDLYEFAPVGYLSISRHGMITEVNWKVTSMFGHHRSQLNQYRLVEFIADEDKERWQREFTHMKYMAGGEELNFDIKFLRHDTDFIANLNCLRMDDDEDQPMLRISLMDVTKLKEVEIALKEREGYQRALLDNFPFAIWLKDSKNRYLAVNQAFANSAGYNEPSNLIGKSDFDLWPEEVAASFRASDRDVMDSGLAKSAEQLMNLEGRQVWLESYKSPVNVDGHVLGTVGFARNIDDRKQAEKYELFRSHILEKLSEELTLPQMLEAIVLAVEKFNPEMICSILLLDSERKHLLQGAAPTLPTFYNATVDGAAIGLGAGSCGTAAFTGERVVVADIASHPYWADYKELAMNAGLVACWSQPVISASNQVLGTFAVYYRQAQVPNELDIQLIEESANFASIAIERQHSADQLRESESFFRSMIAAIPDAIFLKDGKGRWLAVNEQASKLFQLQDIPWQGKTEMQLADLHPEFRAAHEACLMDDEKTWQNGGLTLFEETMYDEQGNKLAFEVRKMPIYSDLGQRKALVIIGRDVTERKLAENEIRIAATAFESQEGMMVTDVNHVILKVNHAFTTITGYSAEEAVGQTPRLLSSGEYFDVFYDDVWGSVRRKGYWTGETFSRRKNGEIYPQQLAITVVKNAEGQVCNHVATITDITESKQAAEEIQRLAFYDPLTLLPNRRLLVDRLGQALVASARTGKSGAILFLDLDYFKTLNDSLGHDIGDMLLKQVAERLSTCVREGDTVARLGGDEYVVLLEGLAGELLVAAAQAEEIGEKIMSLLNQPYQLATHEYQSTPSIGVALFDGHEKSHEDLIKYADIAMYQAKKSGRNAIRFFDPQMQENITARADLERELRKALNKQQLHLYYQLQVNREGQPLGAEALIRWTHPTRGLMLPSNFIPLAEETGLILPIGQWLLDTACAQLKAWEQHALTRELTLSINISAKQFHKADFVSSVKSAIKRHAINPSKLKLELTESMLLDNVDVTIANMNALKEIGIRFSLDDFGTGYSSLQYLKRLPLYQLKIDQSFVRDIAVDSSDQAIVSTIIAMAHTLNLSVIAEGVEATEQHILLLGSGCTHFQGYLFGKPLPIDQFEAELRS